LEIIAKALSVNYVHLFIGILFLISSCFRLDKNEIEDSVECLFIQNAIEQPEQLLFYSP